MNRPTVSRTNTAPMVRAMGYLNAVLAVAAVAALFAPRRATETVGYVAVGVCIAAPLARVAAIAHGWRREGDRRFVALAAGLLGVVALGAAIALVNR